MATPDQILQAKAIEIGKLAVRATTAAGSGHPTTALSLTHLTTVLMYRLMKWDPTKPADLASDRLVLSEGHAVPIIYAACADLGVTFLPGGKPRAMNIDDLMTLRAIDSPIDGHPNPEVGFPFFDAATGSLGQGLSVAAGLAAGARIDRIPKTVYCIIGDGESREGQIWEAMDFIADQKLGNVVAIFNCNNLGQSDYVAEAQDWEHLKHKAEAFGWDTVVIDGHNPAEIESVIKTHTGGSAWGKPHCIIARTVKGWGVPNIGGLGHHGTSVPEDQLQATLDELDKRAAEMGADTVTAAESAAFLKIQPPATEAPKKTEIRAIKTLTDIIGADTKKLSPRRAFGHALKALGDADDSVVALDADVQNSTYSQDFAKGHKERFFECKIAEQNMVSTAAGLARAGKIPFASTFAKFFVRAFDQIEMAIIGGANIKLVGTHVGVTLAADGPSQMAIADVGFMRAMAHVKDHRGNPSVTVLTPSDGTSTYKLVLAMAKSPSAVYLRAVRADLPLLYGEDEEFPLEGHKIVRQGKGDGAKVTLVATGYMVHSSLKAAEKLAASGISATVVDAYSLPLDSEAILKLAEGGTILTVEDNDVGGVGSELAEAAAAIDNAPRVKSLVVRNLPKSGKTPDDVLAYVHLSVDDIVTAASALAAK